jgi:mRNA interferase RelE/StbE
MHKLRIPDETVALIRNLHPQIKKKIRASLKEILSEPYSGKALKDELAGLRTFRVSRFRIVYRIIHNREIEIVTIGPRERIYEETFRIMKIKSPGR